MIRLLGFTGFVVALLIAGCSLLVSSLKRTSLFFPARHPEGDWDASLLPIQPREIGFRSGDGVALHAWFFDCAVVGAPTLIWFHGNAGNLSGRASFAARLADAGVSLFLFDYRGFGKSEGSPTESSLYLDALAAYDYVLDEIATDPESIALYGESLGGPYAAYVASRRPSRCIVIENSFSSLQSVARVMFPRLPLHLFVTRSLRTADWLNQARRPVLVMHGACDTTLPVALGQELYDRLSVPKRLMLSAAAGHCEIPTVEGERYYREVTEFIRHPPADGEGLVP